MAKRPYGTGSIFPLPDGRRWRGAITVNGRRRWRNGHSYEEVDERLRLLVERSARGSTDGLRHHTRRARAEEWAEKVIRVARSEDWAADHTARVIVAQLSPSRVKRNVFGPCLYCGTWLATTVDHKIPTSRGGSDEPENLASACWSCNSRKRDREAFVATIVARQSGEPAA